MTILLHITPYGPSILNVMPRYAVLEFEDSVDRRNKWSEFISKNIWKGPPVVEGYCYNGAFFSPHHFAELKGKYAKQLLTYDSACKAMCKRRTGRSPNPPSDLLSLKSFLEGGKLPRTRKKNMREYRKLQAAVRKVADELKAMMSTKSGACTAPRGVILYLEGLDCAGKLSTGGLVEEVLHIAGYNVDRRRYNRPPTSEQKLRPWMDRFEVPLRSVAVAVTSKDGQDDDSARQFLENCAEHGHRAIVWDRGPAGDFVYNPEFRRLSQLDRADKYREFMAFDKECFKKNVLFLKLMFVTNRDSVAATLGTRLAQKNIAYDLRTWLKSSRGGENEYGVKGFEGLDAIEHHIDPTDFVAFNFYQQNLRVFTNFALNTESQLNPWVVVNTSDRHAARKQLLHAFRRKLERFQKRKAYPMCCPTGQHPIDGADESQEDAPGMNEDEMSESGVSRTLQIQLVVALIVMLAIASYCGEHTNFGKLFRNIFALNDNEAGDD
jgi:polyphosphate kinase 2 (PPK2 family)